MICGKWMSVVRPVERSFNCYSKPKPERLCLVFGWKQFKCKEVYHVTNYLEAESRAFNDEVECRNQEHLMRVNAAGEKNRHFEFLVKE